MTNCPIDKPYSVVVIDTETTGLAPNGQVDGVNVDDPHGPDRICSIALMRMVRVANDPAEWKVTKRRMWLLDPGRPIPEHAAKVNGFAWSGDRSSVPSGCIDLKGKPAFSDIAIWVANFIDHQPIVAHNIAFDLAFLDAELFRAGLDLTRSRVTCTKKAFSDMMGLGRPNEYVKGTNLNALCDRLGVDRSSRFSADGTELHGAMIDAALAAECFQDLEPTGYIKYERAWDLPHRKRRNAAA